MAPNDVGFPGGYRPFNQVLAEAIAELSAAGYQSPEQIARWLLALRRSAEVMLGPDWMADRETRAQMDGIFARLIERGKVADYVPGVTRFTLAMVRPQLRAELDRRIVAAVDLIKLNRAEAVEKTLRRFNGWATAIPPGGDETVNRREAKSTIGKSLAQYRFEKRRCETDQGHKLLANISEIVATDAGAIAGVWHSHGEHDRSYNARKEHLARADKLFLVRDSWAIAKGLVRRGSRPYMDEITRPGQEVSCRCWYTWVTSPRRLPDDVLTRAGQEWIAQSRMAA